MKLIIATANLSLRGGAEAVIFKIAEHYNAPIYTAEYSPKSTFEEFERIDIRVIGKSLAGKLLPYGRVAQGINYGLGFYSMKINEDYDVINAHIAPSNWIRNKNERVLWYVHTPLRDVYDLYKYRMSLRKKYTVPISWLGIKIVRHIDQRITKKIELMLANSNNTRERIKKYYKIDAKVLSPCVDYKNYSNSGDKKYFLYPARISPNKRQEMAIDAFRIFSKKIKGYSLVLLGSVSKDPFYYSYYEKIKEKARQAGNVRIVSNVDNKALYAFYSKATAVLYTPINEDFGLAPLEGMASSKVVISVNEGGPKETIQNGVNGYLVGSVEEMAEKMKYVVEHPAVAGQIGKRARAFVEKNYSWEVFFKKFDKYLEKVSKKSI
ncbi:MAG: glycosyltransferase family 4 protein [Candidatus Micrarchaeia archaeon]